MGMGGTPIMILKEGTKRERGKDAQYDSIMAARAIADAVKSTLGPRGLDKMLVDSTGDVVITNDGVTVLKTIDIQHPAAKMIVEVAKTMDEECGDGTTTAVVLVGELLKRGLDLLDVDIHPTLIANGYRLASEKGVEFLESLALPTGLDDKESLKNIAMTAMMSKAVSGSRGHMADLAVRAVSEVAERRDARMVVDLNNIQIVKREGGAMEDTALIQGIILDTHPTHSAMPKNVENAKIALFSSALEIKKTAISAEIQITDPSQLQTFLGEEEGALKRMVQQLKEVGTNAIFCQKGIDDLAQHFLAKEDILAIRQVKESDMEKLSKATGANIVNMPSELERGDLGTAQSIELRKIEDKEMTFVIGCQNPLAVSILIRGGTTHVIDEIDRSLDDALNVVRLAVEDGTMVTGGGSTAVELAMLLKGYADSVGGREQIAIGAFASALEIVPTTLAENAGLDPLDVLIEMKKAHQAGDKFAGLNVFTGKIVDMRKENVLEPLHMDRQVLTSAAEAAIMILRIDEVIAAKGGTEGGFGEEGTPREY
jgi:archaeal chaperonin